MRLRVYLTPADIVEYAHRLGLSMSAENVRYNTEMGYLKLAARTRAGWRLYVLPDVDAFLKRRRRAKAKAAA